MPVSKKTAKKTQKQKQPKVGKPVITKYKTFWHYHHVLRSITGVFNLHQVVIKSKPLLELLQEITEDPTYYRDEPTKALSDIFCYINALEDRKSPDSAELVTFLNAHFADIRKQLANLLADGLISFDLLWYLFKKGDDVSFQSDGVMQGGRVISCDYRETWTGRVFTLKVSIIKSDGRKFYQSVQAFNVPQFNSVKKQEQLPVSVLTVKNRAQLTERGRIYREIANQATYREYSSHLLWKEWFGTQMYKANGRCMIDQVSFHRQNPEYRDRDTEVEDLEGIPDEMLFSCNAWIMGFSFATKRWGEFSLDHLSQVEFKDNAFDTLVLKPSTKHMVRALVEHAGSTFQDIIYGKGGGCIFLLHGPPGTGKTLTAESLAEVLHRPLYSCSVGELGTTPEKLEVSLRNILEMATLWNAVILIDEADIFLESRTDDADIDRNAMVAIFLRLLEYHQGVLFLTTNRVRSFDRAFHSRISVAIEYPALSISERKQVWNNLLGAAMIDIEKYNLDINSLAQHDVNGRQIKTSIRLAQALAKADNNGVLTMELLEEPLIHAAEFLETVEQQNNVEDVKEVRPRVGKRTKLVGAL